ncbi:SpoIIE family protein phosphatase [Streptomyces sp. NPDC058394]|uniref:SpoIIE family protein phosphatase n=1 Tax=unclassified Streptomyces TaxID=2593676 RepID=UPI00364C67D9
MGHFSVEVGMPLGIDPEADFKVTDLQLEPGTLLAFYTDGLAGVGSDVDRGTVSAAFDDPGSLESVGDLLISGFSLSRSLSRSTAPDRARSTCSTARWQS